MTKTPREKTLTTLLSVGSAFVSVFMLDSIVTDPVNSPKFFAIGTLAFGILGALLYKIKKSEIRENLVPSLAALLFLVCSLNAFFLSNAPIEQSLYGLYGRNNGLLTYLFFLIMFVGAFFVSTLTAHKRIIFSLFAAGIINVAYCGWVLLFGDFFSWTNPYGNILGTFGNPNFIGAFLGMFFSALVVYIVSPNTSKKTRVTLLFLALITAIEIYLSHAIQGRVLMVAGTSLVGFYWVKLKFRSRIYLTGYLVTTFGLGAFALAGALQVGPFTELIYKTSVSLRGQYWLAAWKTGLANPYTGVGFDSFGDWYRRMRDENALVLPGVDTVTNAAHNVPLDLFAFGGWPLLVSYLGIVILTFIQIVKRSIKMEGYDPVFIGLVVLWSCYQLQSIISINQIGLGLWGWLLSGAILSYVKNANKEIMEQGKVPTPRRTSTSSTNPVSPNLVVGISMVIGALVSAPPLASDMKWVSAQKSRSAEQMELTLQSAYLNPLSTQKYFMTIQLFEQSNLPDLAHKYALEAVKFDPNSYETWNMLSLIRNSSDSDKELARKNMLRLDPLNPSLVQGK